MKSALTFASLLALSLSLHAGQKDGTLDLYWIDSEGGGSTLIVTPAGESLLIDSGNPGRDAARIHKVATETAGLTRIDHLLTTHFHIDHFGGAAELSQLIPIGSVHDKGVPEKNPDNNPNDTRFPILIKPYREMKAHAREVIKAGDAVKLRQPTSGLPLSLRCLAADQKFIPNSALSIPHLKDLLSGFGWVGA